MQRVDIDVTKFTSDPLRWGVSLANNGELLLGCLDIAGARSVAEVGAYAGELTGLLLDWAAQSDARVIAVDPMPQPELEQLAEERPALELIRETSHEALRRMPIPDALVIDGDHNWWTVFEELRLIAERAGDTLPLLLFHDVCWPHARRDDYYDPSQVPEEARQPIVEGGGVFPGEPGLREGGMPYKHPAAREGGPRNGVLTAIEDFVEGREGVRLAVVPAFFGLGVVWSEDAPWASRIAELLAPYDRNPLLERLEGNRALHLASSLFHAQRAERLEQRLAHHEAFLRKLLESGTFGMAERVSKVRQGGDPAISKAEVRRLLSGDLP